MTIPQLLHISTQSTRTVQKWIDFPTTDDIKRNMAYMTRYLYNDLIALEHYADLLDFANDNYPQHSGDP